MTSSVVLTQLTIALFVITVAATAVAQSNQAPANASEGGQTNRYLQIMEVKMQTRKLVPLFALLLSLAAAASADPKKCTPAGGMLMTNIGVPDANSTMGYATGDLKGAVGVSILSAQQSGDSLTLNVQHHWVSESGDIISFDPATATATQVAPNVYGIVSYPTHLNGNGTGKFAGVTGDFTNMGEADLNNGRIVLRYVGTICQK